MQERPSGVSAPHNRLLHRADSYVAANVFHAHHQHVSGVNQPGRSNNIPEDLHGFPFTPAKTRAQSKVHGIGCDTLSRSCRTEFRRFCSSITPGLQKYNVGMADDLLRYRSQFPILERTTYLISNSLGAMPHGVYDAMKGYADIWATRGVRAWEERWWMLAAEVGDEIGALMNAPKGSVSTHQNVTTCQAVVASCFDFSGKRNKVVYSDLNFPSVMYFWEAQQANGARVHMVPTDDGITVPTRTPAGRDRRTDLAGPGFARDFPKRLHSGCESHHRESPPGWRPRRARYLSIAGHRSGRCAGSECRLRLRRSFEVAVRRPRRRLFVRASRPGEEAASRNSPAGLPTRIRSASKSDPRATPSRRFAS